jgi:hypothetical protein
MVRFSLNGLGHVREEKSGRFMPSGEGINMPSPEQLIHGMRSGTVGIRVSLVGINHFDSDIRLAGAGSCGLSRLAHAGVASLVKV